MKTFVLISLYPDYISSCVNSSIIGKAVNNEIIKIINVDMKDFSESHLRRVDDEPFGGGGGMVIRADVVVRAVEHAKTLCSAKEVKIVFVSPRGFQFDHHRAKEYSEEDCDIIIVAGHYEGIDQRAIDITKGIEISVGHAIVSNGCLTGMYIIDSVSRYIKGVLGNQESLEGETNDSDGKQHDLYTRPRVFEGMQVPDVLVSGNHKQIDAWKKSFRNK